MFNKPALRSMVCVGIIAIPLVGSEDYKDLPIPQSGLLGRPLQGLNLAKGIIQPMPVQQVPSFTFDVFDGPTSVSEYDLKFRRLVVPAFKKTKLRLTKTEINTLKIKALSPDNFTSGKLAIGSSFAYDGITADTIKMTFRTARNYSVKPEEIIDVVDKYVPNAVFKEVMGVVKQVKINGKDSTERIVRIVNPNVFSKARFITYQETTTRNGTPWENWSISFNSKTEKMNGRYDIANLTIDGDEDRSITWGYYPEFSGKGTNDLTSQKYFFKVIGDAGDLRLIFALDNVSDDSQTYKTIKEIPFKTIKGNRIYSLGYRTVDRFTHNNITKVVRIAVYAKQINPTTIQLINYEGNRKLTYMKYPGFVIKYIDKI